MARATWLADELRSWDLNVVEVDGWRTRGADNANPQVVVLHHTASSANSGDIPSLPLLVNGRGGTHPVPGPLANLGLARSGAVYVVAAGTANNAGRGSWRGISGNRNTFGIEAENDGLGEPWPAVQLDAYKRCVAALCRGGSISVEMVCGHKEWAPGRKIDPAGINLDQFRAEVTDLLAPPIVPGVPMEPIYIKKADGTVGYTDGVSLVAFPSRATLQEHKALADPENSKWAILVSDELWNVLRAV